ncbi:MAG TPA: cupredoxin domain-containing protein [Candidatus Dormibacteraeota bacterium]
MTDERVATRLPGSGNAALVAGALIQAVLGLQFLLGGLNKLFLADYVARFRDFVATSPGAQSSILSPAIHALVLPNVAIMAQLARLTELGAGLVLLLAAAEVARRRLAGPLGQQRRYEPAVALFGAAAALTLGGLSLTIYLLQGGSVPAVNPALAFAPPIPIELFNVPLALGVAWLELGRFRALSGPSGRFALAARTELLMLAVLLVAGLAACGGSAASPPPGSTQVSMIDYRFTPSTFEVKPGSVTFFLINTGTQPHDMLIADPTGRIVARSETVQPGNSAVLTVKSLGAGSYQLYCDIPGHKQSGMVGTLQVG